MPERWRTELRRVTRLHPDDNLIEKGLARPPRPEPPPSKRVKIATIAFALILPVVAIFAAFLVGGRDSVAPATDYKGHGRAASDQGPPSPIDEIARRACRQSKIGLGGTQRDLGSVGSVTVQPLSKHNADSRGT
jgi:hypothetical protein